VGEIVSLDTTDGITAGTIQRAKYGDNLFGVISTQPGVLLGDIINGRPVALKGRVPVKVNSEGGNIKIGDRITVSSVAGVGTKATTTTETVGVALEAFSSGTGTILIAIENEKTIETSQFVIDSKGNIGIGTTTPEYKLHVIGDIAAQSFVNISTREEKENISYYDNSDYESALQKISGIKVATYDYKNGLKNPMATNITGTTNGIETHYLGLIAEEAPKEVLSMTGKGVDLYKLTTLTLSAVKALDIRLSELEAKISADATGGNGDSSSIFNAFLAFLEKLGVKITDGIASFKNLVANTLKVGSSEKPSGITLYDEATGEPYCLRIKNGATVTMAGECAVDTSTTTSTSPANTNAPLITINGANPATLELGAIYSDMGVVVTDAETKNELGYKVYIDDILQIIEQGGQITLDTKSNKTYKITYEAVGQNGVKATAERTVIVGSGTATTTPSETATTTSEIIIETTTATTTATTTPN